MVSKAILLLLPNFNLTALYGILLAILGILLAVLVMQLRIPQVNRIMMRIVMFLVVGGIIWWFGISAIQDILADRIMRTLLIAVMVIALVAAGLFILPVKKKKGR